MSPTDSIGGGWQPLSTRLDAAGVLDRWAAEEPALAGIGSTAELAAVVHTGGDRVRSDEILGALVRLGAADGGDEGDAVLLLLHLLGNGARALALRLRDLSPDIDALVAGELTLQIRGFPWRRRRRGYAASLLMDSRRALLRELKPYGSRMGVLLVDPVSAGEVAGGGLLDVSAAGEDDDLDVVDLLLWAERTGIVDADEVALLVEMATIGRGAPREIAARRGLHERTVRKRRTRALEALRAASGRYFASLAA
jgi:hypothetical protein